MSSYSDKKIFEQFCDKKLYADSKGWEQFISNKESFLEGGVGFKK